MTQPKKIAIAMPYDDWGVISGALAEFAAAEQRPDLLERAAAIEWSIGNPATAAATASAAVRMWEQIEEAATRQVPS